MYDLADPVANRLANKFASFLNRSPTADPELKRLLRPTAEADQQWCKEVLEGTELMDVEGHALFGPMLTADSAARLAVALREHPCRARELLAPFRIYAVPRGIRDTCGTCDSGIAEADAEMVAESLCQRLTAKYGAHCYVVNVEEIHVGGCGVGTRSIRLVEDAVEGTVEIYAVRIEEAG